MKHRIRAIIVCSLALFAALPLRSEGLGVAAEACRSAARAAELRHGVPAGLLEAISRVESGRGGEEGERGGAWPWTISAEGRGRFFPSREDAIAAVGSLKRQGVASIDVGCMQVNLYYHSNAFRTLQEAFSPRENADYAGRHLRSLYEATGDWVEDVGRYHSGQPRRKAAYTARVMAEWRPIPEGPGEYRMIKVAEYLSRRAARSRLNLID